MSEFYWTEVPADPWHDAPAILVGSGPSLDSFNTADLAGLGHVVAVKEAWRFLDPFFEAVICADINWTRRPGVMSDLERIAKTGRLWMAVPPTQLGRCLAVPGAKYLQKVGATSPGFSQLRREVHMGYSSGYAALNFVYHRRPREIYLFGYDYGENKGEKHHHAGKAAGAQVNGWYKPSSSDWPSWARHYQSTLPALAAAGIEVFNCCPGSAITAYPKLDPVEAIERLRQRQQRGAA